MTDQLTEEISLTIADAEFLKEHPELHHYTTEAGLRGIISSNALWATHFSDLNDATEVSLLKQPLNDALSDRFRKLVRDHQSESLRIRRAVREHGGPETVARSLARDLVKSLYQVTFEGGGSVEFGVPFITSFCSHAGDQEYERQHGLLSQWRGYGRDGGYCVVFSTTELANLIGQEFDSHYYLHMKLSPVRYAVEGTSVGGLFPELLDRCNLFVSELLRGNRNVSVQDGFAPFVTGATQYKHQGFREEREVRIVAMPGTVEAQNQVRAEHPEFVPTPIKPVNSINVSVGRHRRYIKLFEDLGKSLPIKRVIVGPSRRQADKVNLAREVLGTAIEVAASATPFIE